MILARGGSLVRSPATVPPLRLRHCWFAQNLTSAQYDTIAEWLGCRPRQLYGMTETIPAVLTDERDDPRCDTMGYVTEGCTVDLHAGEIVVGGEPGLTLFAGYLDDPDTTAASFRDGWFLTGDRATRDDRGRYRFDGRRSDVLKVAGENVSTVEVEQVLAAHPDVADVAVVGMPDEVRDEVPLAFIVPAADASPDAGLKAALDAWCVERLGKAKRPREYRFVDELPRTSVGKIKKYQLMRSPATQAAAGPSS
jgi:crotonobetaine/carnitine-CoA ligase